MLGMSITFFEGGPDCLFERPKLHIPKNPVAWTENYCYRIPKKTVLVADDIAVKNLFSVFTGRDDRIG